MISREVPYSFISARHKLSWIALILGLQEGWLSKQDALENCASLDIPDEARLPEGPCSAEDFLAYLKENASLDSAQISDARLSWLRILMAWIFENRNEMNDPLACVEQLYADFGYPDEIYDLVRFNVPSGEYRPQDHTIQQNHDRFMKMWELYCKEHMPVAS
ncbi:MAG: DUF2247 family protein [Pseudomonadota bacterium]